MDLERLHRQCIYPVVRVRTSRAGGSGTIIYSAPNRAGRRETFILTNHHVVSDAIAIKEEWDPYLSRNVKKEYRDKVTVEIFRYIHLSKCTAGAAFQADIEAYHERQDIALLKLDDPEYEPPAVATMLPRDAAEDIWSVVHIGQPITVVGCSALHTPYMTKGTVTSVNDWVDNYKYFMGSAPIWYGNSGGAVFLDPPHRGDLPQMYLYIGIPSRVVVSGSWFMVDTVTHMNLFIPIHRIYRFLEEECFQFIYDPRYTSEECAEMRRRKREEALLRIERWRRGVEEGPR